MAFLDNSGDIILDAVLTDTGRLRLARGDGSFKITKFAFGDDEINYSSYDGNNVSGSAYYDLEILQTPIFEAFTNNTSNMKSKLISLTNNNLLYLPIIKQNTIPLANQLPGSGDGISDGIYTLYVNEATETALAGEGITALGDTNGSVQQAIGYFPYSPSTSNPKFIHTSQGLDTTEVPYKFTLDPELKETQYLVEADSRLVRLYDITNAAFAQESFIDDDLIATYYFTQGVGAYIGDMGVGLANSTDGTNNNGDQNIAGPRGTHLKFGVAAAVEVATSNYLFDTIGTDLSLVNQYAFIDTNIRITGVTTGYSIDIPLRVLRKQ